MFLNRLDNDEKNLFVSLAAIAANTNGVVTSEEHHMIEEYCREMNIASFDLARTTKYEEIITCYSNSNEQHKKIVILELIGLMYADGEYDEEEKRFVSDFSSRIGIDGSYVEMIETALIKYLEVTRDLLAYIE